MKFENTEVYGFTRALHGMRNPLESWDKNDTSEVYDPIGNHLVTIGPNDLALAQKLIRSGGEHRKFMRQIFVSVDITAPLYWWKEFDTYKVATVANRTSTMHKLASNPITIEDFETDDYTPTLPHPIERGVNVVAPVKDIINFCEELRLLYVQTGDKVYWKELIRWLPESFLQTRTVTMNYENLFGMCSKGQRRFHKLNEWSGQDDMSKPNFITWARTLPYAQDLIFIDELFPDEEKPVPGKGNAVADAVNQRRDRLFEIEDIFNTAVNDYYEHAEDMANIPLAATLEMFEIRQTMNRATSLILKMISGKFHNLNEIDHVLDETFDKISNFTRCKAVPEK